MIYNDAHCHPLDLGEFKIAHTVGVEKLLINSTGPHDWEKVLSLHAQDDRLIPALGIHPWQVPSLTSEALQQLETLLAFHPVAHIGEIGLDKCKSDFYKQIEFFEAQLMLAQKYHRPVHIHCVRAWGEMMPLLKHHANLTFLFHGFSGDKNVIKFFQNYLAFFSVQKATKIPLIPPDKLLVESDAPSGLPSPTNLPFLFLELKVNPEQVAQNFERFCDGR